MIYVSSWAMTVKWQRWEGETIVNASSRGKAKARYWQDILDSWPEIPFTAVRCRKISDEAHTSDQFKSTAAHRGVPNLRCGQRVKAFGKEGVIIGSNASANFNVEFQDRTGSVHIDELEFEKGAHGK